MWLSALYKEIDSQMIPLDPTIKDQILSIVSKTPESLPAPPALYGNLLTQVITALTGLKYFLVGIFDKVKKPTLYNFCEQIFYVGCPLVIFIENSQIDIHGNRLTMAGGTVQEALDWPSEESGLRLEFGGLQPDEVLQLISHCWRTARGPQAETPHPFDEVPVAAVVGYDSPTGLALRKLEALFDHKLKRIAPVGKQWPDDVSLKVGPDDVRDFVRTKPRQ
jgi:hypothetical protein